MQAFPAGEEITVVVPLTRNGEPFVPDNNQVNWELRGHNGSVLSPSATKSGVTDSKVEIVIGAIHSNLSLPGRSEKRTLVITGRTNGMPFRIQTVYRLIPFLNLSVDASDVRAFIGCDEGELEDDAINLVDAFFDVAGITTYDTLAAALAGDDKAERAANRAVVAQAVLSLLPGLPALLAKKDTDGTSTIERFDVDFDALERKARNSLQRALATITNIEPAAPPLIAVTQRTDPLTGA